MLTAKTPLEAYSFENYKPGRVLEICNRVYGPPEKIYKISNYGMYHARYDEMVVNKWVIDNKTIWYRYLPLDTFNGIQSMLDDYAFYEITFTKKRMISGNWARASKYIRVNINSIP
jgi:hypothetical protein